RGLGLQRGRQHPHAGDAYLPPSPEDGEGPDQRCDPGHRRRRLPAGTLTAMAQRFDVTFWGVRGSIACPGADTMRYGGNTACLEVRCGERLLILDAGTGMRLLGLQLDKGPR